MSLSGNEVCILFVEDDENDVILMRRASEKTALNYRFVEVGDSRRAIDYIGGTGEFQDRVAFPPPALVLLDLKLIGSSGFEVLEWLQHRPERAGLPVIVFSSSWVDADVERARALGADEYLVKPNGFEELMGVCRKLGNWVNGKKP